MKKIFISFFLLFFLTACNSDNTSDLPFIEYGIAGKKTLSTEKIFYGFIERKYDVELSFSLSGILKKVFIGEGEFAKRGKLLAQLDNEEYKLDVDRLKYELDNANVKYNRAKSYFERVSKLYAAGGISYNDWENAETDLKSSSNNIKILSDNLRIARNKERFTNIYAPFDGYIIKSFPDQNQFVSAGQKVFIFQGVGGLEAKIFVSETDINSIKTGEKVVLKAESIEGGEFEGVVKSKVNSGIENGAYRVTISLKQDDTRLLDGMSVRAYFKNAPQSGVVVSKRAVLSDVDGNYIFILEKISKNKGIVHKKMVEITDVSDNEAIIKSGVFENDFYVAEGQNKLMDGIEVGFDD